MIELGLELQMPPVRLQVKRTGEKLFVFDRIRKRYLLLTPEEQVRRRAITFLCSSLGYPTTSIAQEFPVSLNGQSQRADIVAFSRAGNPQLLVECKASDVAIDEDVFAQAVRYNSVVDARWIMLTNGAKTLCFERSEAGYIRPLQIPIF